ncbi:MAG: rhodanese-like domain-containing protein [Endozoicomonas sp. (ex Botrylloides leachii)]|nr:rhodanese-like domain-containing protein [Endozoicomonas sp. (ex Botrylloides leachii)]
MLTLNEFVIESAQPNQRHDKKIKNELIIGTTQRRLYHQCHIPTAVNIAPEELVANIPPATGKLPSLNQLEALFSRLGYLGKDQHLIIYDDEGGGWAGRFIWTLDMIGHSNYSYINGGLHAWIAAGLPLESGENTPEPTQVMLTLHNSARASRDYIEANLNSPDTVIWDARSPAEYCGEQIFARRGGHIPGAINYEWTRAMDSKDNYRIHKNVAKELAELGITKEKNVITYCQSHHRSGFTYLVAKALGFRHIKAYDGSWSEWGNLSDTPIEV